MIDQKFVIQDLNRRGEIRFGKTVGDLFKQLERIAIDMEKEFKKAEKTGEKFWQIYHQMPEEYKKNIVGFYTAWHKFKLAQTEMFDRKKELTKLAELFKDTPIKK